MLKIAQMTLLAMLLAASPAVATRVGDITRLDAQREEKLTGLGLVMGLDGTGDGGDFLPAIRPLAEMLSAFQNGASIAELRDADNVAIVALTVTVPGNGVRNGDKLDVHITSVGAAKSLRGGRLFITPLTGPLPRGGGLFALAEGPVILEDGDTPTVGRIEGGCVMERDLPKRFVNNGTFTLVLADAQASWTTASHIAKVINDSEGFDASGRATEYAVALDPKNVVVTVPPAERARPDSFISRVLRLPVPMIEEEARVRINERLGTIVITGDVEISPAVISMNGLTITTAAPAGGVTGPGADPFAGTGEAGYRTSNYVPVATTGTERQRSKLRDLVDALDALSVPSDDRIAILKELHRTGKLHAKLEID